MLTLSFFDWNGQFVKKANIIEVKKEDISFLLDIHIATVETYEGWWEVYNSCGKLVAYWEKDCT